MSIEGSTFYDNVRKQDISGNIFKESSMIDERRVKKYGKSWMEFASEIKQEAANPTNLDIPYDDLNREIEKKYPQAIDSPLDTSSRILSQIFRSYPSVVPTGERLSATEIFSDSIFSVVLNEVFQCLSRKTMKEKLNSGGKINLKDVPNQQFPAEADEYVDMDDVGAENARMIKNILFIEENKAINEGIDRLLSKKYFFSKS